jgi:hypothetical protein
VKVHKHSADAKRHEVAILGERTARPHHHDPNVVRFVGSYEGESSELTMVMELMPYSLAQLLARMPPSSRLTTTQACSCKMLGEAATAYPQRADARASVLLPWLSTSGWL